MAKKKTSKSAAVYSVSELAAAARTKFGTKEEVVTAALKHAGVTEATAADCEKIVNAFRNKEVK